MRLQSHIRNARYFSGFTGLLQRSAAQSLADNVCPIQHRHSTIFRRPAVPNLPDADAKLINIGHYKGVKGTTERPPRQNAPEVELNRIESHMRQNQRVAAESVFCDLLKPLEEKQETFVAAIRANSTRWVPTIIYTCGRTMSNIHKSKRQIILQRMLNALDALEIPLDVHGFNSYLRVLLENDADFDAAALMAEAEEKRKLTLNQESFQLLLEQLSRRGEIDLSKNLSYVLANRGLLLDDKCNASIIYGFAVRGHWQKAKSLYEQTEGRYGVEARSLAFDALAKAAAAQGNTKELRNLLASEPHKQSPLSADGCFDVIWLLASQPSEAAAPDIVLIEKLLKEIGSHPAGFFKRLTREIERHITHGYYYSALALIEDAMKVRTFIQNQQRLVLVDQIVTRLCRSFFPAEVPIPVIREVCDRAMVMLKNIPEIGKRLYDEILKSILMYKDFTIDQRFDHFRAFIDHVDLERERHHLILPLLANCDDTEQRLKYLFRCTNLGYKDISKLDERTFAKLVLQPLYEQQRERTKMGRKFSRLDNVVRILTSYGFDQEVIWKTLYNWRTSLRAAEDAKTNKPEWPSSVILADWLRKTYAPLFVMDQEPKKSSIVPTFGLLQNFVATKDGDKVHSFIATYGWPEDTDFEEIVPKIIDLYLEQLDWPKIQIMLATLSAQQHRWPVEKETGVTISPIKNYHLIRLCRERLYSLSQPRDHRLPESELTVEAEHMDGGNKATDPLMRNLIVYCYELKRLFPTTETSYETFFETMFEYRKLFSECFKAPGLTQTRVEDSLELLRNMIKLGLLHLHANELLTVGIVEQVLYHFGWNTAVNIWLKLQATFYSSNGVLPILRAAITAAIRDDSKKADLQFVLHKAQTSMPSGRLYAIYSALLVTMQEYDKAEAVIKEHRGVITPEHIVSTFRFVISAKKPAYEQNCYNFCRLMLQHSSLPEDKKACVDMQNEWLRNCERLKMGRFAMKMHELFMDAGVEMSANDQQTIDTMAKNQAALITRWVCKPSGLLNLSLDDPIITTSELWRRAPQLRSENS
ncbi:unnamed protein product, partial [Mesorhabditis spiculigera]